jgi:putative transposase
MPRRPRQLAENSTYHVTARGNNRQRIFHSDEDYRFYLSILKKSLTQYAISLMAFTLMPNHVHLILWDKKKDLSRFIHFLHGIVAARFNRVSERVGHVFQDRFYSRRCQSDEDVVVCIRYTHRNPLEAGLVTKLDGYPWSSYKILASRQYSKLVDRKRVWSLVESVLGSDRNALRRFTLGEEECDRRLMEDCMRDLQCGILERRDDVIRLVFKRICEKHNVPHREMSNQNALREILKRRRYLMRILHSRYGFSLRDLATGFGLSKSVVWKNVKGK